MAHAEEHNGIIFYAKRNSVRTVAFGMSTNVGPTYGMYVGPTLYQRYMSNMSYVGATLRKHVGPTIAQRANLRWAKVVSVGPTLSCYLGMPPKIERLAIYEGELTVTFPSVFLELILTIQCPLSPIMI